MRADAIRDYQRVGDAVPRYSQEMTTYELRWPHLTVTLDSDAEKLDADASPASLGTPVSTQVLHHFLDFFQNVLPDVVISFQISTARTPVYDNRSAPLYQLHSYEDSTLGCAAAHSERAREVWQRYVNDETVRGGRTGRNV